MSMMITLVVALDRNGLIGRAGDLPWRLPADLAHFKKVTLGKPILMGRKTFASIGRPLPGRRNVVLTRNDEFSAEGVDVCHSIEQVQELLAGAGEIMVIGGAEIYRAFLPLAGRMVVTLVDGAFEGDTWFPAWPPGADWCCRGREQREADGKNPHAMEFLWLEKVEKK
jgi:dihydrofolate reductase